MSAAAVPPRRGPVLGEVLAVFCAGTLALSLLYQLGERVPFVGNNLSVLAAVLFLYLPAGLLWRRRIDLDRYGFTTGPLGRSLLHYLLAVLIVLPAFVAGYLYFQRHVCPYLPAWLAQCRPLPIPALRLPPDLPLLVLGQVFVVALPEEFFFRGFLQGRLQEVLPAPLALFLAALLFALGHLLVGFEPGTLAVFFPGLVFGLLRYRTGSILAGTLFHASCNLLIDVLHRSVG